jgi:hypothetical protein
MTNVEGRMNNEGILSFYIGIISIKTVERSDFHHSSLIIRQYSFLRK